ncbi:hypothetical protein HHK36_013267 [Tetracentron sinense]|uniref:MADS-box domain-containing protein n=1 Tax=Tetracentron sinense TaxID=13715 RepID=A0A835DGA7_TETSI|nr:hypothetical protein HHK36_013267 [Tetracentron sinense]
MGRRKLEMKKIECLKARQVCFTKRRKGLFKKAFDLSAISGLDIAAVVFSPAEKPFVFGNLERLLDLHFHFPCNGSSSSSSSEIAAVDEDSRPDSNGGDPDIDFHLPWELNVVQRLEERKTHRCDDGSIINGAQSFILNPTGECSFSVDGPPLFEFPQSMSVMPPTEDEFYAINNNNYQDLGLTDAENCSITDANTDLRCFWNDGISADELIDVGQGLGLTEVEVDEFVKGSSKDEKEVDHKELSCTERPTTDTAGSVPGKVLELADAAMENSGGSIICAQRYPEDRPIMSSVVVMLSNDHGFYRKIAIAKKFGWNLD